MSCITADLLQHIIVCLCCSSVVYLVIQFYFSTPSMPYPVLTLPYPFSRRLHQLLTPEELQNLQLAAGQKIRDLKPIVQSVEAQSARFSYTNSKVTLHLLNKKADDDEFTARQLDVCTAPFLKCDTLRFLNLRKSKLKKSDFTHLNFKAKALHFSMCHISSKFLKIIASKIPAIREISEVCFYSNNRIDEDMKLPIMFNIFPNIKNLIISHAYNGWLSELLELNVTDQSQFTVTHTNFDELFSFRPDELYHFVQRQHSDFLLTLDYQCDPDVRPENIKKDVVTLLEPRFRAVEISPDYLSPKILVWFSGVDFVRPLVYFQC